MESRSEGETTDVSEESDSQCRAVVPYSADKPSDFLSWEADRAWYVTAKPTRTVHVNFSAHVNFDYIINLWLCNVQEWASVESVQ